MSAEKTAVPAPRVTIDDLRHRAESVKSLAVTEAKDAVGTVIGKDERRTLMIVAGVVVVAASIAFFLGSRSGRAAMADQIFSE